MHVEEKSEISSGQPAASARGPSVRGTDLSDWCLAIRAVWSVRATSQTTHCSFQQSHFVFQGHNLRKVPPSRVSPVSAPLQQSRVGLYGHPGLVAILIPYGKRSRHASSKSPSPCKRSRLVIDDTFALPEVMKLCI